MKLLRTFLSAITIGCTSVAPSPHTSGAAGTSPFATGDGGEPVGPEYHPPPGFEDCVHAEVREDCAEGWCRLPPSCFVMGSPEDEWFHAASAEDQVAVTLTHAIIIQEMEMTRQGWIDLAGSAPTPTSDGGCFDANCPVVDVTWWDAVHAANLLSEKAGFAPCYAPEDCRGALGDGLTCTGVTEPEKSVYECEGYRLPTSAEFEYAARAGTITAFYAGDIKRAADIDCHADERLDLVAWYCANSGNSAHPIGGKLPNAFGLYDVLGNVDEWTNDHEAFRSSPGGTDPEGQVGVPTRSANDLRVRAGGCYWNQAFSCRAAARLASEWSSQSPGTGFRLVRTLFE